MLQSKPVSRISGAVGMLVALMLVGIEARAGSDTAPVQPLDNGNARKIGLIGDSMMVATHADDMCGAGGELPDCLDAKLGHHDFAWSHGGGDASWSIARRLGYGPSQVLNVADDRARWSDAFAQAQLIAAVPDVDTVFINMGANDICRPFGHDYVGNLAEIEAQIDETLTYLIASLGPGARIYWSGIPNIVNYRNVMVSRRHNYMFRSCQALWDLDSDEITEEAAQSICRDEGFPDGVCDTFGDWADLRDRVMDRLLDYYQDTFGIEEGPCGSVLDSANSEVDRDAARQFNMELNSLLARKAANYDGKGGVRIFFTNVLYDLPVEPNYVSRLDCYHPNRAGQMKMAQEVWRGFYPEHHSPFAFWFDEFDDKDWCTQEFASPWASCWYHYGDPGFDIRVDGEGWLRIQKDTSRNRTHSVVRELGDLSSMSNAWLSFNHKRENLDDGEDEVYFRVFKDGIWHQVDRFRGAGNDLGEHAGKYYDLTPFISSDVRLMFVNENQRSMNNGDRVKFDNFNLFAWGDAESFGDSKLVAAGQTPPAVTKRWYRVHPSEDLPVPAIVVTSIETFNGSDSAGLRIRDLDTGGFSIKIEEEQSRDPETAHAAESVAYAAFAPGAIVDARGYVIGEAGMLTRKQRRGGAWQRLNMEREYADPVVFTSIVTYNDAEPAHTRLRRADDGSFQVQIEEWDYLDQAHPQETIDYVVLESGRHELPGGRIIEVGATELSHRWKNVSTGINSASPPLMLSQCQTYRGSQAVVTRQRMGNGNRPQIRLQEEEENDDSHARERVGYLVITP
jgi:lysophospholipase L1-like esterase